MINKLTNLTSVNNLFFITLLFLSIGERLIFDLGSNVELITVSMLLATVYLGRERALWIVLISLVISDAILGNTNIFIFTWSGFLIPAFFASIHLNKSKNGSIKLIGKSTIFGVGTGLFFFFWTNFGVWALDSWGMYSNDLTGLMQSYVNALPFLRMNILSNLVIIPGGFIATESIKYFYKTISSKSVHSLLPQN